MAKITDAGLAEIAQLQANGESLVIDKMIYANIDGLDCTQEPPGTEVKPDINDIVRESDIGTVGYVTPNTVVYSDVLSSDIGDFSFNWIGLFSTASNTLVAVTYIPLQNKRKTAGDVVGNTICKNFALNYTNIQDITQITIEADTWQQSLESVYEPFGAVADHEAKADPHPQYNNSVPVGTVLAFAVEEPPSGFMECNGAELSRTTYEDLFNIIGTRYGAGDGSTTFKLPDYRGQFLRGWDHAAGIDPDAAIRTDSGDGTTGDNVGTKQIDELKSHNHNIGEGRINGEGGPYTSGDDYTSIFYSYQTSSATGGNETRPANINVMYCIKAYSSVINPAQLDLQDLANDMDTAISELKNTLHENGMTLSNNTTNAHAINIAPGYIADNTYKYGIKLESVLTKQLDTAWIEGGNAGGLASALTHTTDTWYHVFAIHNPTTGITDAGFDTEINATNLLTDATGYTKYRYLGSILTDGNNNIMRGKWYNMGGAIKFVWRSILLDRLNCYAHNYRDAAPLSIPIDIEVDAIVNISSGVGGTHENYLLLTNLDQDDVVPTRNACTHSAYGVTNVILGRDVTQAVCKSNTLSQIGVRTSESTTEVTYSLMTVGYIYQR